MDDYLGSISPQLKEPGCTVDKSGALALFYSTLPKVARAKGSFTQVTRQPLAEMGKIAVKALANPAEPKGNLSRWETEKYKLSRDDPQQEAMLDHVEEYERVMGQLRKNRTKAS